MLSYCYMETNENRKCMELKQKLDQFYQIYNRREYVNPDPLLFLYDYPEKRDREIAGFLAAALAYGRVELIMKSVAHVLEKLSPSPFEYLATRSKDDMNYDFKGFVYRFAKTRHLVSLLYSIKSILCGFSSLEACFCEGMRSGKDDVMAGLSFLYSHMEDARQMGHLVANPDKNSACKRSHLFLRWMVRKDAVDPGGWDNVHPSRLLVPLDTHMYSAGQLLGFTNRKSMDKKTVLEITSGFQAISEEDPVKYDFCLTRFGIRRTMDMEDLKTALMN